MSKSSKKDMGKGIRALLSNIEKTDKVKNSNAQSTFTDELNTNKLEISKIEPNPYQPRIHFAPEELSELIDSIKIHGIIQPIAVRKLNKNSYQIISGERRWRAAKKLELFTVPVHILEADDQAMLEIALLENIQRSDLNPIEVSISYQRLINECNLTHEELSERLGKKRSSISNHLRLLKLSPSVQDAIKDRKISLGHAKVLAGVDRIELQTFLLGKILSEDLSVRATENALKVIETPKTAPEQKTSSTDLEIQKIEKRLTEHLGSKAKIIRAKNGSGSIKIVFGSDDELNDIIEYIVD